jgi:hypothetical protein
MLLTGVTSPSAPATAEQWYFYADSVDDLPKYIYNGGSEQTFYTTANPQTTITGNAGTATALAANPTDCGSNQFATTIAANGDLTCAAITDADVPNTITVSNYLPLAGGTMTGQLVTDNLGIEFDESDVNPTCSAGNYNIFADLSESKLKKCINGSVSDLDTTGGTPSFDTIGGGTNTTAAMVVGTGASLAATGSGTIAATTASALAANGGNCSAGSYPLGVDAQGVAEGCTAYASDTVTFTNKTVDCTTAGNVCTVYKYLQLDLVGVAGGTAGHIWDDDPLSTTCTAASTAGTNQTRAFCTFPDSDGEYGKQLKLSLPTGYVAGSLQFRVSWKTTGTGNLRPRLQTLCYASDAASDAAYSNSTYITAAAGTSGRFNQTAWTTATDTGCDAEETMAIRFSRNRTEASDTLNATADVEFVGVRYALAQ